MGLVLVFVLVLVGIRRVVVVGVDVRVVPVLVEGFAVEPRLVEDVRLVDVVVCRSTVPRVAVARVGVDGLVVVSDPRGLLGRCAWAGIVTRARTKASRVENKIDFFIADALI